jgi:hypothetical protein
MADRYKDLLARPQGPTIGPAPPGPLLREPPPDVLNPFDNPARDLPDPSERGYPRTPNMAPPGTPGTSVMPD